MKLATDCVGEFVVLSGLYAVGGINCLNSVLLSKDILSELALFELPSLKCFLQCRKNL